MFSSIASDTELSIIWRWVWYKTKTSVDLVNIWLHPEQMECLVCWIRNKEFKSNVNSLNVLIWNMRSSVVSSMPKWVLELHVTGWKGFHHYLFAHMLCIAVQKKSLCFTDPIALLKMWQLNSIKQSIADENFPGKPKQ